MSHRFLLSAVAESPNALVASNSIPAERVNRGKTIFALWRWSSGELIHFWVPTTDDHLWKALDERKLREWSEIRAAVTANRVNGWYHKGFDAYVVIP